MTPYGIIERPGSSLAKPWLTAFMLDANPLTKPLLVYYHWTPGSKFQWNLQPETTFFLSENPFEILPAKRRKFYAGLDALNNTQYTSNRNSFVGLTNTKGFDQNVYSRLLVHDWLMLKHQPITTKYFAKSIWLKAFTLRKATPWEPVCAVNDMLNINLISTLQTTDMD